MLITFNVTPQSVQRDIDIELLIFPFGYNEFKEFIAGVKSI